MARDMNFLHFKNGTLTFLVCSIMGQELVFSKIIFREIFRHPRTFEPFIVNTRHKQASRDTFRQLMSCLNMNRHF